MVFENIVITSNESDVLVPEGINGRIAERGSECTKWIFNSVRDAEKAAKLFMDAGFSYVYRPVSFKIYEEDPNNPMIMMEGRPVGPMYPRSL